MYCVGPQPTTTKLSEPSSVLGDVNLGIHNHLHAAGHGVGEQRSERTSFFRLRIFLKREIFLVWLFRFVVASIPRSDDGQVVR